MAISRTAPIVYKRQAQILDFIRQSIENTGLAPTLRQIANAIGVNSLATVHEHMQSLVEKGLLKRTSGRLRKMELTVPVGYSILPVKSAFFVKSVFPKPLDLSRAPSSFLLIL